MSRRIRVIDRIDAGLLRPHTTAEGFLFVECRAAKPGVYEYAQPDGSIRRELIDADVLHNVDSLATLGGKPVTLTHPADFVTPETVKDVGVGTVDPTVEVEAEGGFVRLRLSVQRRDAIEAIRRGDAREVSLGYEAVVEEAPEGSEHPEFGPYDSIQTWRGPYNHVAIVPRGRHGSEVRVRADAVQHVAGHPWTPTPNASPEAPVRLSKPALLSLIAAIAPAMAEPERVRLADAVLIAAKDEEGDDDTEEEEEAEDAEDMGHEKMKDMIGKLQKENADLRDRLAKMEEDAKKADSLADRLAWARDRAALEARAAAAKVDKVDELDTPALRRAVVVAVRGDAVKDASDAVIEAHWHIIASDKAAPSGTQGWNSPRMDAENAPRGRTLSIADAADLAQFEAARKAHRDATGPIDDAA